MDILTLKVIGKWINDSNDVTIIRLAPLDGSRSLEDDLFWYSDPNRPNWRAGDELSDEDVLSTRCYKMRTFYSMDDIPGDCYVPFD